MKVLKFKALALIAFLLILNMQLIAQKYSVSNPDSSVEWEAKKISGSGHTGTISIKSASLVFEEDIPVKAEIVIDMTSIICTDLKGGMKEKLEGHLESDDFFSVEKFPESKFVLNRAESTGDNKFILYGDLSIKGITHPLQFALTNSVSGKSNSLSGTISVDRTLYNVRYGSGKFFDNLGDRAINDIFTLDFVLYLIE